MSRRIITREEFDKAVEAVWSEIQYQDSLPRRTDSDEAINPSGFATLGRIYIRHLEDHWVSKPGPVEECMHDMRNLAAIFVRGMAYYGVRLR